MIEGVTQQADLQNRLDELTDAYLREHPNFVDVAILKDAALKGKPPEDVFKMLHYYPGVIAVAVHEEAYKLYKSGNEVEARQLSKAAHTRTGIDIHPGTTIGENLFIDHGTGDVIGETAKIGKNTQIMHKVTLGAYVSPTEKNLEKLAHRHPEIGDNCFIGVGVELLGNVKVGDKVNILSKAMLHGNNIKVGNNVRIGTGVEIEDGCVIEDGAMIGDATRIINTEFASHC